MLNFPTGKHYPSAPHPSFIVMLFNASGARRNRNLADTGKYFPPYVSFCCSEDPVPHWYVITDKTALLLKSNITQCILLRELNNEDRSVSKC